MSTDIFFVSKADFEYSEPGDWMWCLLVERGGSPMALEGWYWLNNEIPVGPFETEEEAGESAGIYPYEH